MVVRVIAPTGRDSELITKVLQQHGIAAETSKSLPARSETEPVGPLLIAEEALSSGLIQLVGELVHRQPAWSDLPILILTGSGRETSHSSRLQAERLPLGSPVLLERPIRTSTLVSSVQAALRARARQYEIRDAVAELKRERETLQVMLDHLPVGVLLAKPTGEIVVANRRVESMLCRTTPPCPLAELGGEWPAFHDDGRPLRRSEDPLTRAMQAGLTVPAEEYIYERIDGTRAWMSLSAAPVINDQGVVTGGVVALSDIDQEKRSEQALIQSEKLAAVGRLAASISHEINNPLEAVTNLLYLAQRCDHLTEAKQLLSTADQELARVSQIVSHTLRFHRQSTKPLAISAQELVGPTLGLYAGRLSNSNIDLVVEHRSRELISCYEGEIRQVLNNLVGNAVEAMKHGGRLLVRTSDTCAWRTDTAGLRITIADNGVGMSEEVMRRVFEAFYTTKGINGTGLGLWISHGIIEKHHGFIQLRSSDRTGRSGSAFSLFLPREPFASNASQ